MSLNAVSRFCHFDSDVLSLPLLNGFQRLRGHKYPTQNPFYTIHMSRIGVAALLLLLGSVVTSATTFGPATFGQVCETIPLSCKSSGCPEIGCTQADSSPVTCPLGVGKPTDATQVGNPTANSATCSCHHIDNPTPPCVQMHLSLRRGSTTS